MRWKKKMRRRSRRRSRKKLPPMADEAQDMMDDEKEFAITRIVVNMTKKGDDGASQR